MKITYLNHSSFKITGKTTAGVEITIITDPFDPESVGHKYPAQKADLVTLSHQHPDHNYTKGIEGTMDEDFMVLDTPGEYEVKGLIINGIKSYHDASKGAERGPNTIFIFDFQEARVAHLGDLGHKLETEQKDKLEDIDILLIPVGGKYTIDSKEAMDVIETLEPAIVIPMHYKTPKHNESYDELTELAEFTKESGIEPQIVKDFSLKAHKDLPSELTIISFT